jgi:hypothetical protein
MESTRFRINSPKVVHQAFDDEIVMVNLEQGNYYSLSRVGAVVCDVLDRGVTVPEVVEDLCRRYEGDRTEIHAAVEKFVDELRAEGLVVPAAPGHAPAKDGSGADEPATGREPFEAPSLEKYTDMQDLLLLDPIHEVDETGWPAAKPDLQ